MANCINCGKRIGFTNNGTDGRCTTCTIAYIEENKPTTLQIENADLEREVRLSEIEAVLLTTETSPDINIIQRIEIVTAECAFGMNIFKDLFIALTNVVGGRSETLQKVMKESRKTALYELKREAFLVGANAVVGVDLDYVELGAVGSNMVMLVASGTAVIIQPKI